MDTELLMAQYNCIGAATKLVQSFGHKREGNSRGDKLEKEIGLYYIEATTSAGEEFGTRPALYFQKAW
jgi:hypothetical protein